MRSVPADDPSHSDFRPRATTRHDHRSRRHPDLRVEILSPRTVAVDGTTADLRRRFRRVGVPLMVDVRTGRWIAPRRCVEQMQRLAGSYGATVRYADEMVAGGLW